MKRKLLSLFLCFIIVASVFVSPVSAASSVLSEIISREVTYYPDGTYLVTEITQSTPSVSVRSSTQYTSGSKTANLYSTSGEKILSLTVHGSFTYNGKTSEAISARYSYSILDNDWSFSNGNSSCSGRTASATGRFTNPVLLPKTLTVTLSCDIDGVLT